MNLADFTSAGLIIPRLRSQDAVVVILELTQAFEREHRLPEFLPFYHAVLNANPWPAPNGRRNRFASYAPSGPRVLAWAAQAPHAQRRATHGFADRGAYEAQAIPPSISVAGQGFGFRTA